MFEAGLDLSLVHIIHVWHQCIVCSHISTAIYCQHLPHTSRQLGKRMKLLHLGSWWFGLLISDTWSATVQSLALLSTLLLSSFAHNFHYTLYNLIYLHPDNHLNLHLRSDFTSKSFNSTHVHSFLCQVSSRTCGSSCCTSSSPSAPWPSWAAAWPCTAALPRRCRGLRWAAPRRSRCSCRASAWPAARGTGRPCPWGCWEDCSGCSWGCPPWQLRWESWG